MHIHFDEMLELMERTFRAYEAVLPKPRFVNMPSGPVFRFEEKSIYEAMIQKLARVQSLIRAARLLLHNGFVQEQSILCRAIDETNEDIMFLVYAVTNDKITELHQRFLASFWEEEIDESGSPMESQQKRPMVPRQKIRVYLANVEGADPDPSTGIAASKTVWKAYSGYVHGASPHIMDMYGGSPPGFYTAGMLGTSRIREHADDLWNYMYRSFVSHVAVGKALGAEKHVEVLTKYLDKYEADAGMHA